MRRTTYYRERGAYYGGVFLRALANTMMVLLLIAAIVFVLWLNLFATPQPAATEVSAPQTAATEQPEEGKAPASSPAPDPTEEAATRPAASAQPEPPVTPPALQPPATGILAPRLIVPVTGVKAEELRDTFTAARSEGRTHNAMDIMAAAGTPVIAAADGFVRRLMNSDKGGITIYQVSTDGKIVLYYAHLQRYADGIVEGKAVRQGEVIGYVGDTGNAGPGNYHLHFATWLVSDPKKFWHGENLNPYSLLRR